MATEIDIVAYLTDKGYHGKQTFGAEVVYPCFFDCGEDPHSKKRKLYCNTETGMYFCHVCHAHGGTTLLQRHFGDEPARTDVLTHQPRRLAVLEAATRAGERTLADTDEAMLTLLGQNRWLPAQVILDRRLGFVGDRSLVGALPIGEFTSADVDSAGITWRSGTYAGQDFFRHCLLIPYIERGRVVQLRGKSVKDGRYYTGQGETTRLYNADALTGALEVIIVEGEFDAMLLADLLSRSPELKVRSIAVVGLAGVHSLPENFESYFDGVRRIYIGTDPDEPGRQGAERLRERLGSRAQILTWPTDLIRKAQADGYELKQIDWTLWIGRYSATWQDVLAMLRSSSRLASMSVAGARYRTRPPEGVKLGYPQLDSLITPGLQPGQLVIPLAKTGCIYGDAEMAINRGGKGFTISLRDLVHRFNRGAPGRGRSWNPKIPTYVQRLDDDGCIRLGRIVNAWPSGVKQTYIVTTSTGRTIRATDEHPFLTERGWLRLDQLRPGEDWVRCRGTRESGVDRAKKKVYRKRTVPNHPYAGRRDVKHGGHSVPLHRLVVEAQINEMSLDAYLALLCEPALKDTVLTELKFLDPEKWAVHHIDHDVLNNSIDNLMVLTHSEHANVHAMEGRDRHVALKGAIELVVSVESYGMEETYDIEVADDPHNFLANGFVVHNTGKTVWCCNVTHNLRNRRVLYITLEMTAEEIYYRLARIYRFYKPYASDEEIEFANADLRICDQNRLDSTDFAQLIHEYGDDVGDVPHVVIVDYLGYYAKGLRGSSRYEKTSDAVMQLKEEGKAHRVVLLAPHQVNRQGQDGKPLDADDARDSGVVEETGDFVFGLYKPDDSLDLTSGGMPTGKLKLDILKSRHGNKGRSTTLQMAPLSLALIDTIDPAAKQAKAECYDAWRGVSYEQYLRSRTPAIQGSLAVG